MDPQHLPELNPEPSGESQSQPSDPCRTVESLLPAFALGALDPEEREQFLAALQECPQMAGAMRDYAALARLLPVAAATPLVQPPDRLEQRLAAAIRMEAPAGELPVADDTSAIGSLPVPDVAPAPAETRAAPRVFAWPRISSAALAYIAVVAVLILFNLYWIMQVTQLRAAHARLATQLARQSDALALLASADLQEIVLPASQEASTARAEVYWNPDWNVAVLYAEDFPRVEDDMGFQLWLRKGDVRHDAGVFQVDETGSGTLIFTVPEPLDTMDALGITTEPVSGSPGPTGAGVVRYARDAQ